MTLPALLDALRRRIARSHTRGGLTKVARELGISKERLHRYLSGADVPPPEVVKAFAAKLKKG
jgi:DNA-binding phage protein